MMGRWRAAASATVLFVVVLAAASGGGLCQENFTFLPPAGGDGFSCSTYCGSPSCAGNPGCQMVGDALRLIPNGPKIGPGPADLAVRYMRDEAVELWDGASGLAASFRTFFVVKVSRIDNHVPGDGMAFLVAPNKTVPERSDGAGLGVFTDGVPSPGQDSKVLALTFDMLPSFPDDPADAPFVALLVNSGKPANYTQLDKSTLEVVFVGNAFGVWAEYDAGSLSMEVSMLLWPQQQQGSEFGALGTSLRGSARSMFTVSNLNLTDRVGQSSFVGFSAGIKGAAEVHDVFYWDFQATKPGEALPAHATPMVTPPNQHSGPGTSEAGSTAGIKHSIHLSHAAQIALAVAGSLIGMALVASVALWMWLVRGDLVEFDCNLPAGGIMPHKFELDKEIVSDPRAPNPRSFSYEELREATDNFSREALLGEGGFGKVYKGLLKGGGSSSGTVVAVKRFSEQSRQGEKEFVAEVTIIRRLHHRNLVPLRGWCHNKRKGELLLVYDYMPNGSLDQHVLEPPPDMTESGYRSEGSEAMNRPALSWAARYHAIKGVASALLYLHEEWQDAGLQQCVVHRDVKSSNVMLDAEWNARLGDFGLARLVQRNKSAQTASTIVGTRGYLAPEFQYTGRISVQADVYSFGVLVLEVATGRRPVEWFRPPNERFLVKWVRSLHQTGRLQDAADPALGGNFKTDEMRLILNLGLLCTLNEPADRPSMRLVVQFLDGDSSSLVLPTYLQSFSIPDNGHMQAACQWGIFNDTDSSAVPWLIPSGESLIGGDSIPNDVCTAPALPPTTAKMLRTQTPRSL